MFNYRGRIGANPFLSRVSFKVHLSAPLRADRKLSSEGKLPKSRLISVLNLRYRFQSAVVAGVTCFTFVAWMPLALSQEFRGQEFRRQEFPGQEFPGEAVQLEQLYLAQAGSDYHSDYASENSNSTSAETISTKDIEIPVDELKLLIKPLTLEELEIEAAAWLRLLKTKVREISDAEIAIKRKNRQLQKEEEAVKALEEAQGKLEEAEELQKTATEGSPEYEEAAKKVEEAKEALERAQAAVQEASEAKERIEEDETIKKVVEAAEEEKEQAEATEEGTEDEAETDEYEEYYEEYYDEYNESEEPEVEEEAAEDIKEAAAGLEEGEGSDGAPSAEAVTEKKEELEEAAEKLEEAKEEESEIKTQLVVNVTELQQEQTAIVDRFKAVLDELEKKGGTSESYNRYIQAVSGVEIDVTDTEGLGVRLFGWLESDEGGKRWAGNIGKFLGIVVASVIVSQILGTFLNFAMKIVGGTSSIMRNFVVTTVKRGGFVVGILLGLTALEVSLGPVIAVLGGASFVMAFALQSNLGNLASGLMIMFYKPFDVGDSVEVSGVSGEVHSINLASTKLECFDGQIVTIPNNKVWGGNITNKETDIRGVILPIKVVLNKNIAKIEEILMEIAKYNEFILEKPKPTTSVTEYGENYVELALSFHVKKSYYWNTRSDLTGKIKDALEEKGIFFVSDNQNSDNDNGAQPVSDSSVSQEPEVAPSVS